MRILKTLFSIIREGGIVQKVQLFVLDFEIKWDGTACLRPAHTKIFFCREAMAQYTPVIWNNKDICIDNKPIFYKTFVFLSLILHM